MFKSLIAFCLSRRPIVVVGLLLFAGTGLIAFKMLNIEAYPNPTPVILEITAQAPGLSAEEMERYYTRPTEIGLYTTPGVDIIRSTSFYGLSFVRVSFKYGVDYNFAYAQASVAMQQNVSLPGGQVPNIQANSSTGEIYRYQVVGPKHFGITNLRTVQDWIVARRLLTIPGIAAVNSWGGPTKEFQVEVDPHKLEAYSVTVPQILNALGNANINVGGREIHIGQQSINIRGVGLIDDGGSDDLAQGYKVDDIENVVLTQVNGVPVLMKDIGKVSIGYRPRLGILGRDQQSDVVGSIVVMRRTEQTNDMIPKVKAEIENLNHDGSLPPGVKVVPYYDRSSLIVHHYAHGSAQLDIRMSAGLPDSMDFPRQSPQRGHCWNEHPLRTVLRHHSPGDSGGKREPAVGGRSGFRHHRGFGRDPGRERLSEFSTKPGRKTGSAPTSVGGALGARPDENPGTRRQPTDGRIVCG
jgi:cobalt-zinc-cadmium resistance protein CzcA